MNDDPLEQRKRGHIHHVLNSRVQSTSGNGFDTIQLPHNALPEINANDIDLTTDFLGYQLAAPFMISSMTGGTEDAIAINHHLAEAAQQLNIAMGVGSQKIAHLTDADRKGLGRELRQTAPDIFLCGNLGAAQLLADLTLDDVRHLCDDIRASALIIHLNPLQEFFQKDGDTHWYGVLNALEGLCKQLDRPVIVKEVGFGISAQVARQLLRAGVAAIDVAGSGGTNWALVEGAMTDDSQARSAAAAFADWGIATADAVADIHRHFPECPLIASGGVRHGVDAAKAIYLGADLTAQAAAILPAARQSTDAVIHHIETLLLAMRCVCFATGCPNLQALRQLAQQR